MEKMGPWGEKRERRRYRGEGRGRGGRKGGKRREMINQPTLAPATRAISVARDEKAKKISSAKQ